MQSKQFVIIKTRDGSQTLFVPELDETYHSRHGAVQESQHVFITAGLNPFLKKSLPLSLLEVGFGTGLNALLTAQAALEAKVPMTYLGLEPYPLSKDLLGTLNYSAFLKNFGPMWQGFHAGGFDKKLYLSPYFCFEKRQCRIQDFMTSKKFDLVYFDAFAPNKQATMWCRDIFEKIFNFLNVNGVFVTYCAKGSVKRLLKEVGFILEILPGPPGKREMVRARKGIEKTGDFPVHSL